MPVSVVVAESLMKYTCLYVTSVSLVASKMHTIPDISETPDAKIEPQKGI